MPGIWNVNVNYNLNSKKVSSKLSFELGEAFMARIVSSDEEGKELLLKLLDGWQFAAKLEKSLEELPKGLIRFQVVDFQDGKLIIKPMVVKENQENKDKSSLEDVLEEQQLSGDKKDYMILKNMVKHNMPLTKENISKIKTIMDFKEKLQDTPEEGDSFIVKYMSSKGIDPESQKGMKTAGTLKAFFNELKSVSSEDVYELLENGVELTEDNLKSFNKLFKGEETIYKALQRLSTAVKDSTKIEAPKMPLAQSFEIDFGHSGEKLGNLSITEELSSPQVNIVESEYDGNEAMFTLKDEVKPKEAELLSEGFIDKSAESKVKGEATAESSSSSINFEAHSSDEDSNISLSQLKNIIKEERQKLEANGSRVKAQVPGNEKETTAAIIKENTSTIVKENTAIIVKDELNTKGAELKALIKGLIEDKFNLKPEVYSRIMEGFKDTFNDFKVFNTVSNQYYYLDVPLKVKDSEYDCKLIIKDERKKGKKIDSKNVKLAVAVKTVNMGTVDSFLKISGNNMSIDIKCQEQWIRALELGKEKILRELSNMGYNINVSVGKKECEVSLANCRDFFEDTHLGGINTRV